MGHHLWRAFRLLLNLVVVVGLGACSAELTTPQQPAGQSPPRQPPPPLPTRVVSARALVTVDGVLTTATPPIVLAAEVNAKVLSIAVEPGQRVNAGDVLAELDDTALRDALADARLQLALVEAQIAQAQTPPQPAELESARAALAAAQADYERVVRGPTESEIEQAWLNWQAAWDAYLAAQINRDVACGSPAGVNTPYCQSQEAAYGNAYESERAAHASYQQLLQPVSQERIAQARANVATAQARLQALEAGPSDEQRRVYEAQLAQARTAVTQAERNLNEAIVRSPCTCVVQEVNAAVGSVPKGAAFTLVRLDGMQFKTTNLSERELADIAVGNAAKIRLKAYDRTFNGRVASVLPQSTGTQGATAMFTVLITLDPVEALAETLLLPGMTGQAEIEARR